MKRFFPVTWELHDGVLFSKNSISGASIRFALTVCNSASSVVMTDKVHLQMLANFMEPTESWMSPTAIAVPVRSYCFLNGMAIIIFTVVV